MKINHLLTTLLIGVALFTVSCKKKDKVNTCELNEANFSGSYKLESAIYKASPTTAEVDGRSLYFDDCEFDDVNTFNANHTFVYSDEGTRCVPDGGFTDNWSLKGNKLNVGGGITLIENFSCDGFTFTEKNVDVAGDKYTFTLKKQ